MASATKTIDNFVNTYARTGAAMVKGKGSYLFDEQGKSYLDFTAGIAVLALGHSHPDIIKTLVKQGRTLIHASNLFHMKPQQQLAAELVKTSFAKKVFFCNSGTEAMDGAIKFARKKSTAKEPKKFHVLSFSDSFHGRTYGGLSATAQPKFHKGFAPMVPGFHYAPFNDIAATKKVLAKYPFSAIVIEPLQGEGGLNRAEISFLKFLRTVSKKQGIALIFDEIQCGMGRTGTLWHYEQFGIEPDLMTLAKPLGGGLPLGAVLCKSSFVDSIVPGDHGTTFGGNPLACALGLTVLKTVGKKSFLAGVKKKGARLALHLAEIVESNEKTVGVFGSGLLVGIRFKDDPGAIIAACREKGLLLVKAGHNTVRFIPPLTVTDTEIDKAIKVFKGVLAKQ